MKNWIFALGVVLGPSLALGGADERWPLPSVADTNEDGDWELEGQVRCVATSLFGVGELLRFESFGATLSQAERRVLKKCERSSFAPHTCQIAYCEYTRRGEPWDHIDKRN